MALTSDRSYHKLAADLLELIAQGEFVAGDRLPSERALADRFNAVSYTHLDVYKRQVRIRGNDRIISPIGHTWDNFFMNGPQVTDDFMAERAPQTQAEREAL